MEGFDPYVTTSKTATDQGLQGVHERRSLILPSSGNDGGQARETVPHVAYAPVWGFGFSLVNAPRHFGFRG